MMLIQASSVSSIISGRDTGWKTQRRDDGSIPFRAIVERHWRHTVLGIICRHRGLLDLALHLRLDVADHHRPVARHPDLLGLASAGIGGVCGG